MRDGEPTGTQVLRWLRCPDRRRSCLVVQPDEVQPGRRTSMTAVVAVKASESARVNFHGLNETSPGLFYSRLSPRTDRAYGSAENVPFAVTGSRNTRNLALQSIVPAIPPVDVRFMPILHDRCSTSDLMMSA